METLLPQIEVKVEEGNTSRHPRESGDPESASARHMTHTARGHGPLDCENTLWRVFIRRFASDYGPSALRAKRLRVLSRLRGNDAKVEATENERNFVLWPLDLFDFSPAAVWLEIGFGGGEHLAAQAASNPDVGVIGCEPFVNGVASLLAHVDSQNLENVRIYPNDARVLLDAMPDASLDRCFVLFADPWPKKRHHERRFIGPDNLPRLARVMKAGAELRLATDVMPLAEWMREHTKAHPDFACVYDGFTPPADWVQTRYEQKGRAAGREPVYMIFRRV